jgi:hypothetical protein
MKSLLIATAAMAFTALYPSVVSADEIDKKTRITVNETILIPGRELPPGKYVIKLDRSSSNRNIVRIFNDEENQIQATIIAIPNRRVNPTDETVLQYWETPAGSPPALRAWFAPGDYVGQEFAYPKEMADRLARMNNGAKVVYYADNEAADPAKFDNVELNNVAAAPAPQTTAAQSPVLLAQAQPLPNNPNPNVNAQPVPTPQNTPAPQVSPAPAADGFDDSSLPATASPLGWVLIVGFVGLISALALRLLRTA